MDPQIAVKVVDAIPYAVGGLLALCGSLAVHLLDRGRKQKDFRRDQLQKLTESLSADGQWIDRFHLAMLFGIDDITEAPPFDQARALQQLYFSELDAAFNDLLLARHEAAQAARQVRLNRMTRAMASGGQPLTRTPPTTEERDDATEKYRAHLETRTACMDAILRVAKQLS